MIAGNGTGKTPFLSVEHAALNGEPVDEDETGRIEQ